MTATRKAATIHVVAAERRGRAGGKRRAPKGESVIVTLRLPPDYVERAKRLADADDRTLSAFLRRLLLRGLDAEK